MHINTFKIGADPELAFLNPPSLVNGQKRRIPGLYLRKHMYGWDHGGWVVEPHPEPDISVRAVMKNLKQCLSSLVYHFDDLKWRAGAFVEGEVGSDRPHVTLGGHVHLDFARPNITQVMAFDNFHETLTGLDILPNQECQVRRARGGYGGLGDCRYEHGHMEYRSLCSWLFSQRTSMLCMTGLKVAAVDPDSLKRPLTSMTELSNWLENYKLKDDDVRWMFDKGYFEADLTAKPDRDVKTAWKLEKEQGKQFWVTKEEALAQSNSILEMGTGLHQQQERDILRALAEADAQVPRPVRPILDTSTLSFYLRMRLQEFTISPALNIEGVQSVIRRANVADQRREAAGLPVRYDAMNRALNNWLQAQGL